MAKRFIKRIEDFVCDHCSREVKGNGFTNHCPFCLWSKHVDFYPGDRDAACGGLMKPLKLEQEKGEFIMTHECIVCHAHKRNKLASNDDFEIALKAVRTKAE